MDRSFVQRNNGFSSGIFPGRGTVTQSRRRSDIDDERAAARRTDENRKRDEEQKKAEISRLEHEAEKKAEVSRLEREAELRERADQRMKKQEARAAVEDIPDTLINSMLGKNREECRRKQAIFEDKGLPKAEAITLGACLSAAMGGFTNPKDDGVCALGVGTTMLGEVGSHIWKGHCETLPPANRKP